jgi:hypothetical protein
MERETTCNFEEIYPNTDRETTEDSTKQYTTKLLDEPSSKTNIISRYCDYIYNYIMNWFFPSHINSLYE